MTVLEAYKMDGLGNDFIIFDNRKKSVLLTKEQIAKISSRENIGCDQVIFINNDKNNDSLLQFYNSDGGEINACGNGSRCVAYFLMKENKNKKISLKTKAGVLKAELNKNNFVCINMGQPIFDWKKIPLSKEMDYKNLKIEINDLYGKKIIGGFSLSVGNPHIVFFVENISKFNLKDIGPKIENHDFFPQKCNVTLASVKNKKQVIAKVWERGAGLTKACGTAACATAIAGAVLKLNERCVNIEFPKGKLNIDWKENNNIYMTGKVSEVTKITVNI